MLFRKCIPRILIQEARLSEVLRDDLRSEAFHFEEIAVLQAWVYGGELFRAEFPNALAGYQSDFQEVLAGGDDGQSAKRTKWRRRAGDRGAPLVSPHSVIGEIWFQEKLVPF